MIFAAGQWLLWWRLQGPAWPYHQLITRSFRFETHYIQITPQGIVESYQAFKWPVSHAKKWFWHIVMYFDQETGAVHAVSRFKSSFWYFNTFSVKMKKKVKTSKKSFKNTQKGVCQRLGATPDFILKTSAIKLIFVNERGQYLALTLSPHLRRTVTLPPKNMSNNFSSGPWQHSPESGIFDVKYYYYGVPYGHTMDY